MLRMDVTVVGAGASGLTTALRLLEDGHRVTVVAAEPPAATTSAVAAAGWYPYLAEPRDRVLAWSGRAVEVFSALAARGVGGVRMTELVEVVAPGAPDPWFRDAVTDFRRLGAAELPAGHAEGWCFAAPLVPTNRYLPWLADEVRRLGGRIDARRLAHIGDAAGDVIVCCAGLGARDLVGDTTVVGGGGRGGGGGGPRPGGGGG
jgi:D-amino-acid oxidase